MNYYFRGIDVRDPKKKQWRYGGYHRHLPYTPNPIGVSQQEIEKDYKFYIISDDFSDWNMPRGVSLIPVHKDSVGLYTGYEIEYNRVFEGDILHVICEELAIDEELIVHWSEKDKAFRLSTTIEKDALPTVTTFLSTLMEIEEKLGYIEIVGNVWERNLEKS